MKTLSFLTLLIFFSGCAVKIVEKPTPPAPVPSVSEIDTERRQKAEYILKKVESIAEKHNLDYLGLSTMSEAVEIMDIGAAAVPVLVKKLKDSANWKLRYWIVDIMGYIPCRSNIVPLIEVIEDSREKEIVRIRACESLKELRYRESYEYLLISRDIVKNINVREKIEEVIKYIR